jgi:stringent starvation protein B
MEGPPRRLPPKKDVISALLAESGVYIHLDPRRQGVVVPRWFTKQPELVLQIGLNMAIPIHDLEITDEAVSCTLSFNRSPFWCKLPWSAVYAIVSDKDQRGVVWPDDAPPESPLAKGAKTQQKRPRLKAVGPDDEPSAPPPSSPPGEIPTHCGLCSARWAEEQDTCAVCGAGLEEALAAAKKDPLPPTLTESEPRGKKKLSSVPSPQPAPSPVLALAPKAVADAARAKEDDDEDAEEDDPEPTNPAGKKPAAKKSKRKLPPYLRVVK